MVQVEAILGPGEEVASASVDIPGVDVSVPGFGRASAPGVSMSGKHVQRKEGTRIIGVYFQNGKVVSKAQFGLGRGISVDLSGGYEKGQGRTEKAKTAEADTARPRTVAEANEAFKRAARAVGEMDYALAKAALEMRDEADCTWKDVQGEMLGRFSPPARTLFEKWKKDRIAAGDTPQ